MSAAVKTCTGPGCAAHQAAISPKAKAVGAAGARTARTGERARGGMVGAVALGTGHLWPAVQPLDRGADGRPGPRRIGTGAGRGIEHRLDDRGVSGATAQHAA